MDGWGMDTLFIFIGLGTVFYIARDRQKNRAVSILSAIFSTFTVIGISFSKTGNLNCIFLFGTQFLLAVVVWLGYYFVYKNCILFGIYLVENNRHILYNEPKTVFGTAIFKAHPFGGPFILMFLLGLIWVVAFFPGTIQLDAYTQLLMKYGVLDYTGHYPVISTEIMGLCMEMGKNLFKSDAVGVFLYTFPQYCIQYLVFAYVLYIMNRMKSPILLRTFTIFWFCVAPLFQIWGITLVKDTYYYVFFTLMICSLIEMLMDDTGGQKKSLKSTITLAVACICMTLFRNDGKYVVILSMLCVLILVKKYRRNIFMVIILSIFAVFMVKAVYMPINNIPSGPIRESLSIPLQQTARYVVEHADDITDEEMEVLQSVFYIDVSELPNYYNPSLSDSVKWQFIYNPNSEELTEYFKVWFRQLLRHPDTYIQAFLSQTYAYIYPNVHVFKNETYFFYLGYGEYLHEGTINVDFGIKNNTLRSMLMHYAYLVEKMPVFSMITSMGLYTYILLGEIIYIIASKKREKIIPIIPIILVLLVNLAAPVNGCMRYTLPIIATMPLCIAWCCFSNKKTTFEDKAEREIICPK
jgi:hypothetical protein